jgi:tudor domain-containing protein 3
VVQLVRVADVSRPLQTADRAGSGARRLLRLTVTDGHREAKAAEYQPIKQLQPDMRPGTKLQLCNVVIFMGVMLLTEQSVRVLGGRVDALADEWEAERQYTGMHRPDIDLDRPKFHPFDPTSEAARRIPSSSLEVQVAASGAPCTLANPSGADVMPRTDVSTAPAFAPRTKPKLPPKRGEASTAPVKPPALPAPPVKMVGVKTVAAVSQQPVATPAMEEEIPAVASPLTTPAPPAGPRNKEAVRDRLLERFTGTHGGRSTHEGRGGRGRKGEQDDTAGSLTLDEWEQLQAHQAQRNAAHARLRAARRESHVSGSSADTRAAHR